MHIDWPVFVFQIFEASRRFGFPNYNRLINNPSTAMKKAKVDRTLDNRTLDFLPPLQAFVFLH